MRHDETGQLVDFFDPETLAQQVIALCDDSNASRGNGPARCYALLGFCT
jgi:hypothetical protein